MGRPASIAALVLLLLAACDDPVSVGEIAGSYAASTLSLTEGGDIDDLLSQGASIMLTLDADGSTSGRVFIPGGGEGGADFDRSLVGTWTLSGARVSLDHAADTFLRDMTFTVDDGRLVGEETFDSVTLRVVLSRQ